MSVKYYKINGVWNTYSYWHSHYGYTTVPSNAIGFKSCAYATFGQDVDPGYYIEGSIPGFLNWSMWAANSEYAWYNTQMMAVQNHRYPSVAESIEMTDGTVTSPAAMYDDDGSIYYLIRDDMADGWLTEEEATERGWSIEDTSFQARYGVFGIDYRSTDLLPFDETEFEIMQSTGVQQTYGEFVDDAALDWMMSQNQIMRVMVPIEMPNSLIVVDETSGNILLQNGSEYLTVPWNNKIFEDVDNYIVVEPMPAVSILNSTSLGWCCVSSYPTATSLGVNASADLYDKAGDGTVLDRIPYDSTKSYSLLQWQTVAQTLAGRIEVAIESDANGYMVAKNVSSSTISFLQARIVVCSSNQATVVHVLDSSNVVYNAFKYTVNGVDYYYVLDGVQTDWTDDLESIGYYLWHTITLYMASGNKSISPNITNNTGISSSYQVFADLALTTPYYWDYTKRIERGWYSSQNGKWEVSTIQTQADMPSTTGAAIYIDCPVSENKIFFGKNSSGSSYTTDTTLDKWFQIYDDAITVWVNSDHQDHTVTNTQTYVSDVDWDDSVTYKVLYFLSMNGVTNPTGSSVATNRLHYVSFENSGGKVAVKLTLGSISITIAKIVFYAKKRQLFNAYFTSNGQSETTNSSFSYSKFPVTLYDESGNTISSASWQGSTVETDAPFSIVGFYDKQGNFISASSVFLLRGYYNAGNIMKLANTSYTSLQNVFRLVYEPV